MIFVFGLIGWFDYFSWFFKTLSRNSHYIERYTKAFGLADPSSMYTPLTYMYELSVRQHSGRWACARGLILARRAPIFPRKISKKNMKNIRCHVKHAN